MTTFGFALRRLGASIILLLLLSFLTFALYKAIPANPAGFLVDMQKATPDQIAKAEEALHLHDPFYKQYGDYLWRLVHGDLGIAYQGTSVTPDGDRVGNAGRPRRRARRCCHRGARDRRSAACSADLDSRSARSPPRSHARPPTARSSPSR